MTSTSAAEPVDLVSLVREAAAENPAEPAPARIADIVMAQIPGGTERALLALLLPRFVGDTLRRVEQTAATDPRAVWGDLLTDRVPTEEGYRFLRDCTTDDIRTGATRRRTHAEALVRRAELYESIAERLDAGLVPETPVHEEKAEPSKPVAPQPTPPKRSTPKPRTPGELPAEVGVELVTRSRGYVAPTGSAMKDVPAGLRPSITELLQELAMIPTHVLVRQFVEDEELLEKVALADARGWTTPEMRAALESDELVELTYDALTRVAGNMVPALATARANGDEKRRKQIGRDHMRVQERMGVVKRLVRDKTHSAWHDPARGKVKDAEWAVVRAHSDEYKAELARRLVAAGLPVDAEHALPSKEHSWAFAVEQGMIEPTREVLDALALGDDAFLEMVRSDINGVRVDILREGGVATRWQRALKVVAEHHLGLEPTEDPSLKARRYRFHAALMQRQAEAKRVLVAEHQTFVEAFDVINRESLRREVRAQVREWLLEKYPNPE